jgi:hypothetical protein
MSRRREGEGGQRGREIGEEGGNGGKSRGREAGEAVVGEEAATEEGGLRAVTGGGGKKRKKWWGPRLEGKWRASKIGEWEGKFGGVCKIWACLEALLELCFFTKPSNFGVEAPIEAPTCRAYSPGTHTRKEEE